MDTQSFSSNAKELGHEVESRFDNGREKVSDALHQTADTLRSRASEGYGRIREVAHKTADGLSAAADYTRTHNANEVWADLTSMVRRRPVESIAAAIVLGILVGKSLRRDH